MCVYFQILYFTDFFLLLDFDFYKPTVFKVQPPISGITAHAPMPGRLEYLFLLHTFDQNQWCMKNGPLSGVFNPQPLSHESSALTTRPQLLSCFTEVN
jgi:hypothetical protein